jgi:ammonia channel protein AmtB
MLIPLVTITFFFFGWWIYFAFPNGPGITGGLETAVFAEPWSELMGPHMGGAPASTAVTADDTAAWARINGVFWAAFLLFSWTAASIVSGAVIERIRSSAFWVIAVMIGSITWVIDAAWGWHSAGWMVQILGYHDAYASGVIHAIAGGTALGVLVNLGPRVGKFRPDGTARDIQPHNPWLVTVGLFFIYAGFWGFYVACNVPMWDIQAGDGVFFSATNIYLAPTTLSAITVNFLMSLAGGLLVGYIVSKGQGFWTYSGGLAGIIAASAGNDLYHPIQAMIIAGAGTWFMYKMHFWVENRFKVDDAVGAVAVHGYAGVLAWLWPVSCCGATHRHRPRATHRSPHGASLSAPSSCLGCSASFRPGCCAGSSKPSVCSAFRLRSSSRDSTSVKARSALRLKPSYGPPRKKRRRGLDQPDKEEPTCLREWLIAGAERSLKSDRSTPSSVVKCCSGSSAWPSG